MTKVFLEQPLASPGSANKARSFQIFVQKVVQRCETHMEAQSCKPLRDGASVIKLTMLYALGLPLGTIFILIIQFFFSIAKLIIFEYGLRNCLCS